MFWDYVIYGLIVFIMAFYVLFSTPRLYKAAQKKFGATELAKTYPSYNVFANLMAWRRLIAALIILGLTFLL